MRMNAFAPGWIVLAAAFAGLLLAFGCEKQAVDKPGPQAENPRPSRPLVNPPLKWVSFVTSEMAEWNLNARNTAYTMCSGLRKTPEQVRACIDEKVPQEQRMRTWRVPLHAGPSIESEQSGEIRITGKVFQGFTMQFIDRDGAAVPFEPDNFLEYSDSEDLRHTVLEQKGRWVLLPRKPFPSEVWIEAPPYRILDVGHEVYEWQGKSIVILERKAAGVFVREEISADNTCEEPEDPITEDMMRKFSIPWSDLYDENRHLRLKQKYTIC